MIINLLKVPRISIPALKQLHVIYGSVSNGRIKVLSNMGRQISTARFSSDKDKDKGEKHDKQGKDSQPKQPKIIQISKQQYAGMKKFLQDIKMSMPMPDISPFISSSSKKSNSSLNDPQSQHYTPVNPTSVPQSQQSITSDYFSNLQQILSFKLLKLTTATQFLPIFQQYSSKQDVKLSIKLIILHRYCSIGGQVNNNMSKNTVQQYAYRFLENILGKMGELDQKELEEFLQLYIGLRHKEKQQQSTPIKNNKYHKQSSLPLLNLQQIQQSALPLTKQPSHINTKILILLLQLYQLQYQNSSQIMPNNSIKQKMRRILQHYQLRTKQNYRKNQTQNQNQTQNNNNNNNVSQISQQIQQYPSGMQYDMKDLAYIGVHQSMFGIEDYNALNILVYNLKNIVQNKEKNQDNLYTVVKVSQCLLQNVHKLSKSASVKTLHTITQIKQLLIKILSTLTLQPVLPSLQQTDEQSALLASPSSFSSSVSLFSVLHQCLLTLQSSSTSPLVYNFTLPILTSILNRLNQLGQSSSQTNAIKITSLQYCQLFQSLMLAYKSNKSNSNKYFTRTQMYNLLNQYIGKCPVKEWASIVDHTYNNNNKQDDHDKIIQEDVREIQRIVFECLVGYRMMLPYNDNTIDISKYKNIKKQVQGVSQTNQQYSRQILKDLLTVYRKTVSTMYNSHLITSPSCPQIHNISIALMIAQSYPNQRNQSSTQSSSSSSAPSIQNTHSYLLLSPTVIQMLKQFGVKHQKYGAYVQKILKKYNML